MHTARPLQACEAGTTEVGKHIKKCRERQVERSQIQAHRREPEQDSQRRAPEEQRAQGPTRLSRSAERPGHFGQKTSLQQDPSASSSSNLAPATAAATPTAPPSSTRALGVDADMSTGGAEEKNTAKRTRFYGKQTVLSKRRTADVVADKELQINMMRLETNDEADITVEWESEDDVRYRNR